MIPMRIVMMIIRWLLAAACIGVFIVSIRHGSERGFAGAAGLTLIGVGALALAPFFTLPETVIPLTEFLGNCFVNMIFPSGRFEKPPLSYFLADFYTKKERYPEAIHEYQKIIRYYPDERTAYLALISIYNMTRQSRLAEKYLKRFRKHFNLEKRARGGRKVHGRFRPRRF